MAPRSKSKPAALTGSLLATKGAAGPSGPSQPPTVVDIKSLQRPPAEPDDVAVLTDGTGGFQIPIRLDPDTYVALRLAAARGGATCQQIIEAALRRFLSEEPGTPTAGPSAQAD